MGNSFKTTSRDDSSIILQAIITAGVGLLGVWNTWIADGKLIRAGLLVSCCFLLSCLVGLLPYDDKGDDDSGLPAGV